MRQIAPWAIRRPSCRRRTSRSRAEWREFCGYSTRSVTPRLTRNGTASWGSHSHRLVETLLEEIRERGGARLGLVAFGTDGDRRAFRGGEHQDAHDALAVHFLAVLHQGDVAGEAVRGLDDE